MDTQVVTALIGLTGTGIGAIVGGGISWLSSRSTRRLDWQLAMTEKEIRAREDLYSQFLAEARRLVLCSISKKISDTDLDQLTELLALDSKISFHSPAIAGAAKKIVGCIIEAHSSTPAKQRGDFNLEVNEYVRLCKEELETLRRRVAS